MGRHGQGAGYFAGVRELCTRADTLIATVGDASINDRRRRSLPRRDALSNSGKSEANA